MHHALSKGRRKGLAALAVASAVLLVARTAVARDGEEDAQLLKEAQGHFRPLPKDMATPEFPVTPGRVRLGRMLFFDPRISADGAVSCSRCHLPSLSATDALPRSIGVHGRMLPRNAQTVLGAALGVKQHWDGRFANVEEQARNALLGPGFGNPDYAAAMARVRAIPGYVEGFRDAFPGEPDPVNETNWGKAIGSYERTLVAPSRFDDYLGGKADALSAAERKGLRTFVEAGCVDCHKGPLLGGLGFRTFGRAPAEGNEADEGRFLVTKQPEDRGKFKVAGLREVARTPPYFHDGSVGTLSEAVRIMARVQLDADLSDAEVGRIVAFLGSLSGTLPEGFREPPALPASGFESKPTTR